MTNETERLIREILKQELRVSVFVYKDEELKPKIEVRIYLGEELITKDWDSQYLGETE